MSKSLYNPLGKGRERAQKRKRAQAKGRGDNHKQEAENAQRFIYLRGQLMLRLEGEAEPLNSGEFKKQH